MSIPLDRLYHFINDFANNICSDCALIYRFWPHGSKKIKNLVILKEYQWENLTLNPFIICFDQEPLDYNFYQDASLLDWHQNDELGSIIQKNNISVPKSNIRCNLFNIYDKGILLHSEQRSHNVELYSKDRFIPVYYWSHAIISLDWFRFAQYVNQKKKVKKIFLIYNRAWSGTREYRLRFSDLLIELNLQNYCQTSINSIEPELDIHYSQHQFKNLTWRPTHSLENYFPINTAQSHYSADFDLSDYENTDIEIVLETLFDDSRLHLTEKSLRPIACGQPFILAGTHGSLEYLRSYGFKTFGHIWDEGYDLEVDPEKRLVIITNLMKEIATWDQKTYLNKLEQAHVITEYNKTHFFSKDFFNQIINELSNNLINGFEEIEKTNTSKHWLEWRSQLTQYSDYLEFCKTAGVNNYIDKAITKANQYYTRSLSANTNTS